MGRKGIRNGSSAVAYLVECAHHVAPRGPRAVTTTLISSGFRGVSRIVYAQNMMERLCTHTNVRGVILVSLGCESFDRHRLADNHPPKRPPVETSSSKQRRRHPRDHSRRARAAAQRPSATTSPIVPARGRERSSASSSHRSCGGFRTATMASTGNPPWAALSNMAVEGRCDQHLRGRPGELIGLRGTS